MDLLGGAKPEILRTTLIYLLPGVIIAAPAVFIVGHYQPELFGFADDHPTLSTVLSFFVAAALGMVAYDIGSHIEADYIDRRLIKSDKEFQGNWQKYLRVVYPERSVAQSYIHSHVLNLKFELGMAASFPLCLFLSFIAWYVRPDFPMKWLIIEAVALSLGTWFFFYEAMLTAHVLAKTRHELLKGFGSIAPPAQKA
jgi:hypothetical protein